MRHKPLVLIDLLQNASDLGKFFLHVLQKLQLGAGPVEILAGIINVIIGIAVDGFSFYETVLTVQSLKPLR